MQVQQWFLHVSINPQIYDVRAFDDYSEAIGAYNRVKASPGFFCVELVDAYGEAVRSSMEKLPSISAPNRPGLYVWDEAADGVRELVS